MMAFIRQTVLEYQSLSAGLKDLSARFQKADSTLKGRILVSDILDGPSADAASEPLAVAAVQSISPDLNM